MKAPRRKTRPVDLFAKGIFDSAGPVLLGTFKTVAAAERRALEMLRATVAGKRKVSAIIEAMIEDCTTGVVVPGPRFMVNEEWTKILRKRDGEWEEVP